jgi:hypothetical protein
MFSFADRDRQLLVTVLRDSQFYVGSNTAEDLQSFEEQLGVELDWEKGHRSTSVSTPPEGSHELTAGLPAALESAVFGPLRREDGFWTGSILMIPGKPKIKVTIEPDLSDSTDAEMTAQLKAAEQMYRRLTADLEATLRRNAADDVINASRQQSDTQASQLEYEQLAGDMVLAEIGFYADMATFVWSSPKYFPNQRITLRVDSDLQVDEVMVQD